MHPRSPCEKRRGAQNSRSKCIPLAEITSTSPTTVGTLACVLHGQTSALRGGNVSLPRRSRFTEAELCPSHDGARDNAGPILPAVWRPRSSHVVRPLEGHPHNCTQRLAGAQSLIIVAKTETANLTIELTLRPRSATAV